MTHYTQKNNKQLTGPAYASIVGAVGIFLFLFGLLISTSDKLRVCKGDYVQIAEEYEKQKTYSDFIYKRFSEQSECIATYDNLPQEMRDEIKVSISCISNK